MTSAEYHAAAAAVALWRSWRPPSYSEAQHLGHPTINTHTAWEAALARAVAELLMRADAGGAGDEG